MWTDAPTFVTPGLRQLQPALPSQTPTLAMRRPTPSLPQCLLTTERWRLVMVTRALHM